MTRGCPIATWGAEQLVCAKPQAHQLCYQDASLLVGANPRSKPWNSILRVCFGCVVGLTSQQWGQKKAAAKALADLAEAGGDALPPHTPTLVSTILQVFQCPSFGILCFNGLLLVHSI